MLHDLLPLITLAVLLTVTPGPDTMLVMRNVFSCGRLAGIATGFGACCGLIIHAALSSLGLSAILLYSSAAFWVLKMLGACYLVYLGLYSLHSAWLQKRHDNDAQEKSHSPVAHGNLRLTKAWSEGFLSNVLNPKVVVFYLAILPQVIQSSQHVIERSLLFTCMHFIIANCYLAALSLCLGKVRHIYMRPSFRTKLESVTGGIMVIFGCKLALERMP